MKVHSFINCNTTFVLYLPQCDCVIPHLVRPLEMSKYQFEHIRNITNITKNVPDKATPLTFLWDRCHRVRDDSPRPLHVPAMESSKDNISR
ncbi:hypothetical protein FKM82_023928 [Ascaphus truei]